MRPERLEVSGFGVFREPVEIDFRGAELFALSGPTGAGKSTIIDAIVFALYGSVPRYDDKRKVGPAISEGKAEARVRLDFTVGEQHYVALRIVRRKGTAGAVSTDEARLERIDADGRVLEVLAGSSVGLTDAVEQLLGLTYDHFTTCVVLPQGDFQRFLHAKPSARQDLLVQLLDLGLYGRMAQAAKARATAAQQQREWVAQQLDGLAGATVDRREALDADIVRYEKALARIDSLMPEIEQLTRAAGASRAEAEEAQRRVHVLAELELPAGVAELGDELVVAGQAVTDALDAEASAAELVTRTEALLDELPDRDTLAGAAQDHAARAGELERIAQGEKVTAAGIEVESAATADLAAARAAHDAAVEAVEAARRRDRAHEFAASLVVGEPCPVCLQVVADEPHHELDDLKALTRAEKQTAKVVQQAVAAHTRATADRTAAEGLLEQLRDRVAELDARLRDHPDPDAVQAHLQEIDQAQAASKEHRRTEAAARAARVAAEKQVKTLRAREQASRQAFGQARDAVVAMGPPTAAGDELLADWQALLAWVADELPAQRAAADAATLAAEEAEARASRRRSEVVAACEDAGIDADRVPHGRPARDVVVEVLTEARSARTRLDEELQRAELLRAEQQRLVEEEQVSSLLATHLKSTHFEKWVLDEVLRRLVAGATEILRELSSGTYSLSFDGAASFSVIDHANADVARSARTLSGGETFLASLALALALADEVAHLGARGTVRLESIFLDEGFGSLDADTLDVVATAIEELGASGRMVGVVSHVRDLADRLPVRFEVDKIGNAATVKRVDA